MNDETNYGYGQVPTLPTPARERPLATNPVRERSLKTAAEQRESEASIRQRAAEAETGGDSHSTQKRPVWIIDVRGVRKGPFNGECLVSALANHPGCHIVTE